MNKRRSRRDRFLAAILWFWSMTGFNASFAQPASPEPPSGRVDRHGDALPPGASARLGTTALRSRTREGLIAFLPDGKKLAVFDGDRIRLWDLDRRKVAAQLTFHKSQQSPSPLRAVTLEASADGQFLAAVSTADRTRSNREEFQLPNYQLNIWELSTGSLVLFIKRTAALFTFCGAGRFARVEDGKVKLYRIADGTTVRELPTSATDSAIRSMTYLARRKEIVTGHANGRLVFQDIDSGKKTLSIDAAKAPISSLSCSADGKVLAVSVEGKGMVSVWDVPSRKQLGTFDRSGVRAPVLSPDGSTFAGAAINDVASGKVLFRPTTGDDFRGFRFTPDGKRIAGLDGGAVVFWDSRTGKRVDQTDGHEGTVTQVGFSPCGTKLASASFDRTVRIWDVNTARERMRFEGAHAANSFAWSPDGRLIAHASGRTTWLRDSGTGKVVRRLKKDIGAAGATLTAVSFSASGRRLITAGVGEVRWWDVATGESRGQLFADLLCCWAVLFRNEDQVGFAGSQIDFEGNVLALWDAKQKRLVRKFGDGRIAVTTCVLTPDEEHLLVSTRKGILVFEIATGHQTKPFGGEEANCMAFDARGATLASGSGGRVTLWDFAARKRVAVFDAKQGEVSSIGFSPDGRMLATGGADTTILLWRVADVLVGDGGPQDIHSLWQQLGDDDVCKRYRAWQLLAARPAEAMPMLRAELRPTAPVRADRVKALAKRLDDPAFQAREQAVREMVALGDGARHELERIRSSSVSLEARRRIEMILSQFDRPPQGERRRRQGIMVLESIGNEDACELLQELGTGAAGARVTIESQAALKRLRSRCSGGR